MNLGFNNLPFEGSTIDGENWVVTKPLLFLRRDGTLLRVIPGATTDGPSVPHWAASGLGRTGPQWLCGVLHDAAYRLKLESQMDDGSWKPVEYTKAESDSLFSEALQVQGLSWDKVDIFYIAVRNFGQSAFDADRGAVHFLNKT